MISNRVPSLICCFMLAFFSLAVVGCAGKKGQTPKPEDTAPPAPVLNVSKQPPPPSRPASAKHGFEQGVDGRVTTLADQVVRHLEKEKSRRVAIKGIFDLKGEIGDLERYLEIELTQRLFDTGMFQIVEREVLEQYGEKSWLGLAEEAVSKHVDEISEDTAKKIGRVLDIDSILIARTVVLPTRVKVNVRLISTRTATVFGAASVLIPRDRTVEKLVTGEDPVSEVGTNWYGSYGRQGDVIRAAENEYWDLIPNRYRLYVKQVHRRLDPFSDTLPNVEIFLNDEYKVMGVNEMLTLSVDESKYVLTLRAVSDRMASFTFAKLKIGVAS